MQIQNLNKLLLKNKKSNENNRLEKHDFKYLMLLTLKYFPKSAI